MKIFEYSNKLPNEISAAVVLGAGLSGCGSLEDIELTRRSFARALMTSPWFDGEHRENTIIFSGGYTAGPLVSEAQMMHQAVMLDALSKSGSAAPKPNVLLEQHSKNTFQNFTCTREILGALALHHVAVVTDVYHMPRALRYANEIWPSNTTIVPVVALYQPTYRERAHELVARAITPYRLRRALLT